MRERRHGQMKNEIMNGNQGDHVTFVWSWRRSKQRLSFCRTFHPFIQHHNVFEMSRMYACLQNVQPLYSTFNAPALWKTSQVWVSSAARQERLSMFLNFTKITLENIWILN